MKLDVEKLQELQIENSDMCEAIWTFMAEYEAAMPDQESTDTTLDEQDERD